MVEVKVLREENLAAAEQLYVASVRDNPQGFIQQLHLFPNIKTFIRQAERDGGIFAGVFENGQIVGMGGIVRKSDREAEVCKLHVRKEFKGRGYGEKLLNYLERMARLKGFEKLRLHVTMSQRPAINLYRKSAFLPTGNEVYMTEIEGKTYEYDTLYMEKLIV